MNPAGEIAFALGRVRDPLLPDIFQRGMAHLFPAGEILARDRLLAQAVVVFSYIIKNALLEGVHIAGVNLLLNRGVAHIHALGLFLIHVNLGKQALFDRLLVPLRQDQRMVDLPDLSEILALIDLAFQLGDNDLAHDLRGDFR